MDGDARNITGDFGQVLKARVRMNSLVTTLTDCGMLTIGVFVLVATDVLFA